MPAFESSIRQGPLRILRKRDALGNLKKIPDDAFLLAFSVAGVTEGHKTIFCRMHSKGHISGRTRTYRNSTFARRRPVARHVFRFVSLPQQRELGAHDRHAFDFFARFNVARHPPSCARLQHSTAFPQERSKFQNLKCNRHHSRGHRRLPFRTRPSTLQRACFTERNQMIPIGEKNLGYCNHDHEPTEIPRSSRSHLAL